MKINRLITVAGMILLLIGALLSQSFLNRPVAMGAQKFLPLNDHLTNKTVDVKVKSKGGHQEDCIMLTIRNLTSDTLFIMLEPGRRLVSKDSTEQDILIVKERTIAILPFENIQMSGYGFCCQSSNGSPNKNSEFSTGFMTPDTWIHLAEVISKHDFPASAVQQAVWVLSDNHSISSIHDNDMKRISVLRETVAEIMGIEIPWYSITYEKDTSMLFSGRAEKVWGEMTYRIRMNTVVTINVRSKSGMLMKTLVKGVPTGSGYYDYPLDLDVRNWPKGEYDICVYEDFSNLIQKKTFRL